MKLSMFSAAHQCVLSQLSLSAKGALPGGYSCISMNAEPPPWVVGPQLTPAQVGALESEFGVQAVPGKELGSHRAMENHGAGLSSNHFERSDPGCEIVGRPPSGRGRGSSVQVTLPPDPGALDSEGRVRFVVADVVAVVVEPAAPVLALP